MNIEVFLQIFLWFKFCTSVQICIYLPTFVLIYTLCNRCCPTERHISTVRRHTMHIMKTTSPSIKTYSILKTVLNKLTGLLKITCMLSMLLLHLKSLYKCHCFCQIGLLIVVNRWITQPMQYFPSYRTIILLRHIYNRNRMSSHATKSLQFNKPRQSLSS